MKPKAKTDFGNIIIFDSSTLINFVLNGLITEFKELKNYFNGKFIITREVMQEVITKPMDLKRFKLEALKIKQLVDDKILETPSSLGIKDDDISKRMMQLKTKANNLFFAHGNPMTLIHSGETSCLALFELLAEKSIKSIISTDERTTRLLGEKPGNLLELLHKKLHTRIDVHGVMDYFRKFKFIRSTEIMYVAYKKGIIRLKNHDVLDALLYALKINGCSISDEEIKEIERIG